MGLVDKDVVVAEIERRIEELQKLQKENGEELALIQETAILICIKECNSILSFINSLEIKNVENFSGIKPNDVKVPNKEISEDVYLRHYLWE